MSAASVQEQGQEARHVPGLAEGFNEDMRELGEWAWWLGIDPAAFGVILVAEALRRRRRDRT